MQRIATLGLLLALCGASAGCALVGLGGTSVLCGDSPRVGFYYATFTGPRAPKGDAKKVWSGSRSVVLGDAIGVAGTDITDVRIVGLSRGTSFNVGGAVVDGGRPAGGSTSAGGQGPDGQWRLDVGLSGDGAAKLSAASEEVAGSYRVLALVVGDEVFSASVEIPVRFGVAQIEFPTGRAQEAGRSFFREQLGCKPGGG